MTAKEKFEARLDAFGLREEWELNNYAGVQTDKEIIVLVHYEHDGGYYNEFHYPRFDQMDRKDVNTLSIHFAKEYCNDNPEEESSFLSRLARWCAGENTCPLYPCDVYTNIDPIEEIEFEDDAVENVKIDIEEEEYLRKVDEYAEELCIISQYQKLHKHRIVEMIRNEFERGHNLYSDFDPYPGWDSHHLCGYEIMGKSIYVDERKAELVLVLREDGYEDIFLPLEASDFPIEVLFNIYSSMI